MEIRKQIDPNNTLPPITLEADESAPRLYDEEESYRVMHEGKEVGQMKLITRMGGQAIGFRGVEIQPELRGRGLGMSTYVSAIEEAHRRGLPFTPDLYVSNHAKKVWETLEAKGVATRVEGFEEVVPGSNVFQGDYYIDPPKKKSDK